MLFSISSILPFIIHPSSFIYGETATMSNDTLSKMSEQYQNFLAPVIKANKLSATNLEALVNFQMSSLQSYVDVAMNRMRAAADISDPTSLQVFLTSQAEVISSLNQKVMDDAKALADLTTRFKADFDKLVQDTLATRGK